MSTPISVTVESLVPLAYRYTGGGITNAGRFAVDKAVAISLRIHRLRLTDVRRGPVRIVDANTLSLELIPCGAKESFA